MARTKTSRIEARVSPEERKRLSRAAELANQSVSSFLVDAAMEKAEEILAEAERTPVPADYFDELLTAIDRAEASPRLRSAAKRARERSRIR